MDVMGAFTGLTFAKSILQNMLALKVESQVLQQVTTVLEKLGAAQDAMFQMREDLFRLQTDNEALRRDLAARDSWEAQKASYKLEQTSGGALVYVSAGPPPHFGCPACFAKNAIHILQNFGDASAKCPNCKTVYVVRHSQLNPTMRRNLGDW